MGIGWDKGGVSEMAKFERIQVVEEGDVAEVSFVDRKILDPLNIHQMSQELTSLVMDQGQQKLLLRCGDVEFLSSAALNALILLNKRVIKSGGKMVITELRPEIYEVFLLTNLNTFFSIFDDRDAGLAAF